MQLNDYILTHKKEDAREIVLVIVMGVISKKEYRRGG
jgi:hypothetical protein